MNAIEMKLKNCENKTSQVECSEWKMWKISLKVFLYKQLFCQLDLNWPVIFFLEFLLFSFSA